MKLGDKKQAVGLGIGAIFAVGMFTKTALGTLGTNSSNHPIVIRDSGSPLPKSANFSDSSSEAVVPTKSPSLDQPTTLASKVDLTTIRRDAFEVPTKTSSFNGDKSRSRPNRESYHTGQLQPANPGDESPDSMKGVLPGAETSTNTAESDKSAKAGPAPKPADTLRFDGFIEAGSPTGVLSMNGQTTSVVVGDSVGQGFRVESISSQKITIRKRKIVMTIYIGQETHI